MKPYGKKVHVPVDNNKKVENKNHLVNISFKFNLLVQTDEIEKLKETLNKIQTKPSSISDHNHQSTNLNDDKTNINYKTKWEEAETKCRILENKCHQLETVTVKQLQDKIDQLQRDHNQMKVSRHERDQSFLVPVRKKISSRSRSRVKKILVPVPLKKKFWSRSRSKKEIWFRSQSRSRRDRDHFAHL